MTGPERLIGERYRLVERLATGGMGIVWKAWDERLHRLVAIKQLHAQPGLTPGEAELAANRAMREARITARLHHPHAVPVYDVVEQDGEPYLIMQFLPSQSLQAIIDARGALPPAEVARIGAEIASALAAAHRAGVVHRDVKPGNVLIAEDGVAKLTDFGISRALGDTALTSTGIVTGTPAYLAPEIARGAPAGFASDVFSLGSTLYAAVEGRPPFGTERNPMAVLHRVASGEFDPPVRSGALTPLILRMLARDPAERPPMHNVAQELAQLRASTGAAVFRPDDSGWTAPTTERFLPTAAMPAAAAAAPPSSAEAAAPGRRRGSVVIVAVMAVLVLATVVGLAMFTSGGRAPTTTAPTMPRAAAPSPSASASSPVASSSAPAPPSSSAPSASPSPVVNPVGPATAGQLSQALVSYYALLPGGTDQAWNRLTPSYQISPSGGRQGYQNFWDSVQQVTISNVVATPPGSADATITYVFRGGRVVVERTSFGLVEQNGILKINSSQVLSSQTQ